MQMARTELSPSFRKSTPRKVGPITNGKKNTVGRESTHLRSRSVPTKCCLPSNLTCEMLKWLPDPILAEDSDHFKKYNEVTISFSHFNEFKANSSVISHINTIYIYFILKVKDTETTEKDCPSLVVAQKKKKSAPAKQAHVPVTSSVEVPVTDAEVRETSAGTSSVVAPQFAPSTMTSTQNARFLVTCVECRKPRVLYSLHKLSERQKVSLVVSMSEYDYTCGEHLSFLEAIA